MPDDAFPTAGPSRLSRFLRAPALHFTLAGTLGFLAARAAMPAPVAGPPPDQREIVVDASRIEGLRRDYALTNPGKVTEAELRALVDSVVTDEILFREALARDFQEGDRSIAWRLVSKMRYLGEDHGEDPEVLYRKAMELGLYRSDPVVRRIIIEKMRIVIGRAVPPPSEEEVEAWYREHGAEFAQAERVSLVQVYFDRTKRGAEAAREAAGEASVRAEGHGPEVAASLGGDPFVLGGAMDAQSRGDLVKFFGPAFADSVLALPEGKWSAPVESTFGWHVVYVTKQFSPHIPDLDEVRSRVVNTWQNQRRSAHVEEFLAKVRPHYDVRIDEDALREAARG